MIFFVKVGVLVSMLIMFCKICLVFKLLFNEWLMLIFIWWLNKVWILGRFFKVLLLINLFNWLISFRFLVIEINFCVDVCKSLGVWKWYSVLNFIID